MFFYNDTLGQTREVRGEGSCGVSSSEEDIGFSFQINSLARAESEKNIASLFIGLKIYHFAMICATIVLG